MLVFVLFPWYCKLQFFHEQHRHNWFLYSQWWPTHQKNHLNCKPFQTVLSDATNYRPWQALMLITFPRVMAYHIWLLNAFMESSWKYPRALAGQKVKCTARITSYGFDRVGTISSPVQSKRKRLPSQQCVFFLSATCVNYERMLKWMSRVHLEKLKMPQITVTL